MKATQLRAALQQVRPDSTIVLSSDGEGNSYSPLAALDGPYIYIADSTWSGEVMADEDVMEIWEEFFGDEPLDLDRLVEELRSGDQDAQIVYVAFPVN
jgi:hypothetical protein